MSELHSCVQLTPKWFLDAPVERCHDGFRPREQLTDVVRALLGVGRGWKAQIDGD